MSFVPVNSTWIQSLQYVRSAPSATATMPEGTTGFLIVKTAHGTYGWAVPSYVAGLLAAAQARGLSVGRTFNQIVKRRDGQMAAVRIN
jgi:hypothetical protein